MAAGGDSPRTLWRPQGSPGTFVLPSPHTHFSPRDLGTQSRGANPPGASSMGGAPLQDVQCFFSVSFPIPGRGEAAGASPVPTRQLTCLIPTLAHPLPLPQGPGLQA